MACTVAVEEVIDEHYQAQAEHSARTIRPCARRSCRFATTRSRIATSRSREGAEESPGYDLISAVVKTGSRIAIWLSTRL